MQENVAHSVLWTVQLYEPSPPPPLLIFSMMKTTRARVNMKPRNMRELRMVTRGSLVAAVARWIRAVEMGSRYLNAQGLTVEMALICARAAFHEQVK